MANQPNRVRQQDRPKETAVAVQPAGSSLVSVTSARLPITNEFAKTLEVTHSQWRVLVDQIFPAAKSVEAVVMALAYCRARNLDIYKKPVHIVPMYSSALGRMVETVWPGISEIRTTAARTGQYAGIDAVEHGDMMEWEVEWDGWERDERSGQNHKVKKTMTLVYPEWSSVVVYRMVGGVRCPFHAKIYWLEAYAKLSKDSDVPNEMWRKRPIGQPSKCVEAAALRMAFPEEVGSMYAAEEMEGQVMVDAATPIAKPASAPNPNQAADDADDVAAALRDSKVEDASFEDMDDDRQQGGGAPNPDEDEYGTDDDDDGPSTGGGAVSGYDYNSKLDQLDTDMAAAKSLEIVEDIWQTADLEAEWTHHGSEEAAGSLRIARGIKSRHDKRIQMQTADKGKPRGTKAKA